MAQNKLPVCLREERLATNSSPLGGPRKKILFLITKATWGGAQRYVYDLATHLSSETYESVVAFGEPGKLAKMLSEAGIKTHGLSSLRRDVAFISDVASFFQILVCLWRVRPAVLHLNSSKAAALGALAARMLGVRRIVFTVHGWPFNEKRSEFARVMMYLVSWFTAFLSHAVIVVSKSDEAQGGKMRLLGDKIRYIPIGIDPPLFLSREEATSALSLPTTSLRVGTIAELTPNKGLGYAIEAISILKEQGVDLFYSIIGDGEQRAELEEIAAKFGVEDRVTFRGFISDAAKYLRAFDVFVLPSIKEGMPYVLLEAAFADLPIVTTNVVDPDFVRRYSIRPIEPSDPEDLAVAIQRAVGTRPYYKEYPTLEKMMVDTINLY